MTRWEKAGWEYYVCKHAKQDKQVHNAGHCSRIACSNSYIIAIKWQKHFVKARTLILTQLPLQFNFRQWIFGSTLTGFVLSRDVCNLTSLE